MPFVILPRLDFYRESLIVVFNDEIKLSLFFAVEIVKVLLGSNFVSVNAEMRNRMSFVSSGLAKMVLSFGFLMKLNSTKCLNVSSPTLRMAYVFQLVVPLLREAISYHLKKIF